MTMNIVFSLLSGDYFWIKISHNVFIPILKAHAFSGNYIVNVTITALIILLFMALVFFLIDKAAWFIFNLTNKEGKDNIFFKDDPNPPNPRIIPFPGIEDVFYSHYHTKKTYKELHIEKLLRSGFYWATPNELIKFESVMIKPDKKLNDNDYMNMKIINIDFGISFITEKEL